MSPPDFRTRSRGGPAGRLGVLRDVSGSVVQAAVQFSEGTVRNLRPQRGSRGARVPLLGRTVVRLPSTAATTELTSRIRNQIRIRNQNATRTSAESR
jgi:hypothetical protein